MNSQDTNAELRDLYRELILDHARNPRHFGKLPGATHTAEGINPLCGDKLKMYLRVADENISEAMFEGSGCAISVASASLLTDAVTGHSTAYAQAFLAAVRRLFSSAEQQAPADFDIGKLKALQGVREFPARIKCATLAWHALDAALNKKSTPATTE